MRQDGSVDIDFIGGMNIPANRGRASATIPLARLTLSHGCCAIRPRVARKLLAEFIVPVDQVSAAFPLRGRVLTAGIGLTTSDGATAYFWTWHGSKVLDALRASGVSVESVRRRATKVWRFR